MKAESHISSALPLAALGHWPALIGVVAPDLAWILATVFNGFKKPEPLPAAWMPVYRIGHSLLVWIPLAVLAWKYPILRGFVAGGWLHLLMDWPTHTGNCPLWPLPWSFDGRGA